MRREDAFQVLKRHLLADGFPLLMDIEASHGSWIIDDAGHRYLDMFSMFASSSVGYNHPHIVKNLDFLGRMAVNKPTLSDVYNKHYADFVKTFEEVAMPPELSYIFFISGGALAVENALKAAFDWRTRLNLSRGIAVEADQVIHFREAFHGRSGYTLSLTNTFDARKYAYFPRFDWPRILNPKMRFPLTTQNLEKTLASERQAEAQILQALEENPHKIACVIIEPIQAEGGDHHFRGDFLRSLRKICDAYEILLILDEVQSGMGVTGKMWAYQHFDFVPDIIAFGKKTQVCGVLAHKEKLDRVEKNVFRESSRINSTFGGNFIDMIRFKLILEIIEKENLIENVRKQGEYLLNRLQALQQKHPEKVSNARGRGLMCAFDLIDTQLRDALRKRCFERRMIILPCGEKTIRFRPHLNVLEEELSMAVDVLDEALMDLS